MMARPTPEQIRSAQLAQALDRARDDLLTATRLADQLHAEPIRRHALTAASSTWDALSAAQRRENR